MSSTQTAGTEVVAIDEGEVEGFAVGGRISYSGFRVVFVAAWLLLVVGLVCVGAHIRVGFVLFVCAGIPLAWLGAMLALNSAKLSDWMIEQVESRWGNSDRPLSVSRFGGALLLVIGCGIAILGLLALAA